MKLGNSSKTNRYNVGLENSTEACLFISEGIGLFSISGLLLALDTVKAKAEDHWPVETTLSDKHLKHAATRMSEEAARLGVIGALPGFGEYPEAVENEINLLNMSAKIRAFLEPAKPETIA